MAERSANLTDTFFPPTQRHQRRLFFLWEFNRRGHFHAA